MKKSNILFFALLCSFSVIAQTPQIQWQKSLGGTGDDQANSIIQTIDSGFIVAGYSSSNDGDVTGNHDSLDYWVVKLNSSGIIEWQKSLGGTSWESAYSIIQTFDSGYAVAGSSQSNDSDVTGNHGGSDYWVVKLNAAGTIEWQKSIGGTGDDEAYSIIQTSDTGYVVSGYSRSNDGDVTGNHGNYDYWVVKINSAGTIQWQKSFGGSGDERAYSIIHTSDSKYIVAGFSYSNDGDVTGNHGGGDYWVVKLDAAGGIVWQKTLGGTGPDIAQSIIQTSDSGYAVAGSSYSYNGDVTGNHGGDDYWVVKLNPLGTIQWQKSLGGTYGDAAYSILQTSDSGYIVTGSASSSNGDVIGNHGSSDNWLLKLNALGQIEWQKSLGGTEWESAYSIIQTSDSGFVLAGFSGSINGDVTGNHGSWDYWVVKLGVATGVENLFASNALNVYPNPFTNTLTVNSSNNQTTTITIYDITSRKLLQQQFTNTVTLNTAQLSKGIYIYTISDKSGVVKNGKVIKE